MNWPKIRRMLAIAVGLVAGGLAVGVALRDSGVQQGVDRSEWCTAAERLNDASRHNRFYAALPDGVTPPADKIGACADGVCVISPQGVAECPLVYAYGRGPPVVGWRIWTVDADSHVAGYLRRWVLDSGGRWYDSRGQVVGACLAHFSPANCLALLGGAASGCWLLDDGDYCVAGVIQRNHAPGDLVPVACPAARILAPIDCVTSKGAGGELRDVSATFAAEDYEEPQP